MSQSSTAANQYHPVPGTDPDRIKVVRDGEAKSDRKKCGHRNKPNEKHQGKANRKSGVCPPPPAEWRGIIKPFAATAMEEVRHERANA